MTIQLTFEARRDILEAYIWNEQRRTGLGEDLLLCLDEAYQRIKTHPLAAPSVYQSYRRCVIRRFPYVLYYRLLDEEKVVILGLFHARRNPTFIQERLFPPRS